MSTPRTQKDLHRHYNSLLDHIKLWCEAFQLDINEMISHLMTATCRFGMGADADPIKMLDALIGSLASAYKMNRDELIARFLQTDLAKVRTEYVIPTDDESEMS